MKGGGAFHDALTCHALSCNPLVPHCNHKVQKPNKSEEHFGRIQKPNNSAEDFGEFSRRNGGGGGLHDIDVNRNTSRSYLTGLHNEGVAMCGFNNFWLHLSAAGSSTVHTVWVQLQQHTYTQDADIWSLGYPLTSHFLDFGIHKIHSLNIFTISKSGACIVLNIQFGVGGRV